MPGALAASHSRRLVTFAEHPREEAVIMIHIIDNEDGTKSLTVNSGELRTLLEENVPDLKQLVQSLDTPAVRATVDFVKAVVA
jgi:hypothetical protein